MATRIQQLAQPKPNQLRYPDRRSVYWLDKLPPQRSGLTTKIELTPRWLDLCITKKLSTQITVSPMREVSEWALRAVPSRRLCRLAQPRAPAAGWQPDRPLLVPVSRGTQMAGATSRICQLAQPKRKQVLEESIHKSEFVKVIPLPSKTSALTELLATPKSDHPKFKGDRSVCWPVSRPAKSCVASQRLIDLSSPKERKLLYDGYHPYVISRAACSASPSPRIQQLCLPLPRKCSSQKEP